jgi:glycosyltransferase involved in cell wall biosynthesis
MVMCGNSGTAYWRFYNWWVAAHRTKKSWFHVLGWEKECNDISPWQLQIGDANHQAMLFGQLYAAAREADVIIFQRLETPAALTTFYAMRDQFPGKPILSELDDDIVDVAAYNQAAESLKPGSPILDIGLCQLRNSDGLITSTPYLADVYSEYCKNIYVVPNSIDVQKWEKAKGRKRPGIRVGWIGSTTHSEDLELLEKVIPRITVLSPDLKFVFASAHIPEFLKGLKQVEIVEKWVPILKYPAHMASLDFDIGLAPLRDNKFNRAKSNLRWLEYSALGIPCVASRVGHFAETIRHGEDGYLASNEEEWCGRLTELVLDVKTRRRIGSAAKKRINLDFNVDRNVDLYLEAIEDVLTRPAMTAPSLLTGVDEMISVAEPAVEMGELRQLQEGEMPV